MDFDTLAAQVTAAECSPSLAAQDEASYCETILPLVYAAPDAFAVTIDARDDEAAEDRAEQALILPHACTWECSEQGCPTISAY